MVGDAKPDSPVQNSELSAQGTFDHFRNVRPAFGYFSQVRREFDIPGETEPLVAIKEISFDLEQFELISLLGPSGCGKTTLLRIVAGLERASGGIVRVRGEEVTEPQQDFGVAFQTASLMPWRTVLQKYPVSHGDSQTKGCGSKKPCF